ncbi:MAG: hypothetical protein IJY94_05435 [Clostridia bacterium]|nr:hypothetical protein [Clostridia bacterium]
MKRYIDANKIRITAIPFENINEGVFFELSDVRRAIEQTPTEDVEPIVHGKWIPRWVAGKTVWECSECRTSGSHTWKRCPVCEAKMDGERKCE